MKFRAHDTFFIRKGWLAKGAKHIHTYTAALDYLDYEKSPNLQD